MNISYIDTVFWLKYALVLSKNTQICLANNPSYVYYVYYPSMCVLLRLKTLSNLKKKKMQKYVVWTIFLKNYASTNFRESVLSNDFASTKIFKKIAKFNSRKNLYT